MLNRFLILALLACTACSSAQKSPSRGAASDPDSVPVIDVHTHARFTGELEGTSKIPQTEEEYFRQWQEAGVVGAVSHTGEGGKNYNDGLREKNIIQCYGLGPKVDSSDLEAGLRSGKFGCVKVYLGYVHQYAYDKAYEPAYKLAQKYDVPVVFHTGDTYSTEGKIKYSDPMGIDEVAVDHPKVRFVIAHCGNPWIQTAAEIAYKNPNVWLECSAMMIGNMDEEDTESVDKYVVEPIKWIFGYLEDPSKLMFGTDWPLSHIGPYLKAYKRAIPKEHWRAVFYENAKNVFKGLK